MSKQPEPSRADPPEEPTEGTCIDCGEPAVPGWTVCQACDDEHRKSNPPEEPSLDELDAFCAGEMGWPIYTSPFPLEPDYPCFRIYGDGHIFLCHEICVKKWRPSRDIAQAFMVEEELPEEDRGLYAYRLQGQVRDSHSMPIGLLLWRSTHATAHQRCRTLWRMKNE